MMGPGIRKRAARALARQLAYQRRKAADARGHEAIAFAYMARHSNTVRRRIEQVAQIPSDARVLEVGCGAHGLIFLFEAAYKVGVDPLADHYRDLFPAWQDRAETIAAPGEDLPFADASFDLVLCDNVVDHAESPRRILEEIVRVLAPGGLLYFTVNVHHPLYHLASSLHAGWRALGVPFEITPFADHTVHLTPAAARSLFDGLPLRTLAEGDDVEEVRRRYAVTPLRHPGDRLKKFFFKNARYEVVAARR